MLDLLLALMMYEVLKLSEVTVVPVVLVMLLIPVESFVLLWPLA